MAVTSIPCPRPSCTAAVGEVCKTSAVVHHERRDAALAQGLWDPGKALAGEYGDLAGCPLEALKPAGIRRGRPPARPRELTGQPPWRSPDGSGEPGPRERLDLSRAASEPPSYSASTAKDTAMNVLESRDYQAARERIKGNPIISMMAAGVVTVPLAELAHEDGTPRSGFMNQANRTFDDAEARNAGNPAYQPYPPGAHRHLGLIAEAVLAERAAMRAAVASAMAAPGTDPESADVTRIIGRMRAGEAPVEIARQTGAIAPGG